MLLGPPCKPWDTDCSSESGICIARTGTTCVGQDPRDSIQLAETLTGMDQSNCTLAVLNVDSCTSTLDMVSLLDIAGEERTFCCHDLRRNS